ncbi:hypothetical protein BDW42DRAFT_165004 [Aspergillus taichungensis]|uniref:Uncharacterized protein n=1 Tax=Aspergillus taichungensis TaxID=482145 RepID=A0A2J5I0H7_9EURO|nr:hypothetical protein BDW42DRAFT_165004 [Aspergillus taichungensis]
MDARGTLVRHAVCACVIPGKYPLRQQIATKMDPVRTVGLSEKGLGALFSRNCLKRYSHQLV